MIDCGKFYRSLGDCGIGFFAGVPDSLLKHFCAYLADHAPADKHVIAANEGGAVGLAAGHYLATGKPAMVYLQNSGQGNAMNPLLSLCDPEVYGIPMLLLVGWRGEPGNPDEPQHVKQGRVMKDVFEAMEIPHEVLSQETAMASAQVERLLDLAVQKSRPVALVVKKGTFSEYKPKNTHTPLGNLSREEAIGMVAGTLPSNAVVVSTTGHISRELYAYREKHGEGHGRDFMAVGGMGHASQVALGIALAQPERPVFCFDGDGAVLMHMGGLALVAQSGCGNLKHIVFNNGVHGSVGGQPTVAASVSLVDVARTCGYRKVWLAEDSRGLKKAVADLNVEIGPGFLEVRVSVQARHDLGRPDTTPHENKMALMGFLHGSKLY